MPFAERPILILEDDVLLAFDLEDALLSGGFRRVLTALAVRDALVLVERQPLGAAILDFELGSETSAPVARRLAELRVPFMVLTGAPERARLALPNAAVMAKPAAQGALIAALTRMASAA